MLKETKIVLIWLILLLYKYLSKKMTLKEIVKDNIVHFNSYRKGILYYKVTVNNKNYRFPVPIEDTGDATFLDKDKAILFMRYIRKALNENTFEILVS